MEYVATNEISEDSTNSHVGGEVLQTCDSRYRHRGGGAVSQKLYPRMRILVRQHTRHGPCQAGML